MPLIINEKVIINCQINKREIIQYKLQIKIKTRGQIAIKLSVNLILKNWDMLN
jgi:hypothetical protein